jgi:hypothetical protein
LDTAQATRDLPVGGCWPTSDQVLLLRAGLFEADRAADAWGRWRARNDPDTTDRGSTRLLPLVYRNVGAAGLSEPDLSRLKGAYRAAWFRNNVVFQRGARALQALNDAGIRTMLLKGAALAVAHYHDPGLRPMDDIDVLVPATDARRARDVLLADGWSAAAGADHPGTHAWSLVDDNGWSLDLHRWSLYHSASDDVFWASAVEIELLGVPTRALCPADQLLHVAAHGARWQTIPPVRWLADATTIQRSSASGLDWDRVVAEATRRRLTVKLVDALEHLHDAVELAVPAEVLARLRAARKAPFEAWVHRATTRPVGNGNWLPVALDSYRRASRLDPSIRLAPYLQEHFAAATRRQLARRLARKTVDVGVAQAAMRVAPRLARRCRTCGWQLVTFRRGTASVCAPCTAADDGRAG